MIWVDPWAFKYDFAKYFFRFLSTEKSKHSKKGHRSKKRNIFRRNHEVLDNFLGICTCIYGALGAMLVNDLKTFETERFYRFFSMRTIQA